jgi:hypothetical protein
VTTCNDVAVARHSSAGSSVANPVRVPTTVAVPVGVVLIRVRVTFWPCHKPV